jgi:hypothetical protein
VSLSALSVEPSVIKSANTHLENKSSEFTSVGIEELKQINIYIYLFIYMYWKLLASTSRFISRESKRILITIRCGC